MRRYQRYLQPHLPSNANANLQERLQIQIDARDLNNYQSHPPSQSKPQIKVNRGSWRERLRFYIGKRILL